MRPLVSPSSRSSASGPASASPITPSSTAATRSARRRRRPSSCTIARTACASARATSAASPETFTPTSGSVVSDQRVQLVLESAALDRAVDAALLGRARLPPPAARPARGARLDRARAGCAADRRVAAVVQRVVRHVALADVVPDLVLGPLGERVQLHDRAVVVVDLDLADVRAARPLVAAQAGDPCVEPVQVLRQRPHLANA